MALTTASQASTPQTTLTTCANLTTHIQIALKATQKSCPSLQAPAIWHMVQSNTALPSGSSLTSIRICTSKRPQFTYQYIRAECPTYTVSTDYYRAVTPPATPSILSSSAVGYGMAELNLARPAASDSPIAYYLVKNLTTGVVTQVSPNALAQLYISGLSSVTSYSFTVTAVSVDGTATNSSTSQVVITAALPAVLATDATLSSLIVTTATLSPVFSSSTTSYTSTVSNGTTSVTLTPTVNESHATITVNGTAVASGSASGAISLSIGANTITTVVTAQNGSTKTYSIVITRSGATDTTISAFSFAGLSPAVTGVVDNTAHTVALTVPYGTSKSTLVSTFTIGSGATATISTTAQVSGTTANDFTSPVTYTITAQDGVTTQDYIVTVTVAIQAPAFTLSSSSETRTVNTVATGFTVSSTGGAIASFGISPSAPAGMSFSTSTGAFSGTPTTGAVSTTYTITATNASGSATQTFAFTIVYNIGDTGPGSGIVFYYSAGAFTETGAPCGTNCHYFEWAPNTWSGGGADPTMAWASDTSHSSGASGTAVGTGFANTTAMLTSSGSYVADTSGAAFTVHAYHGGGKTDWFLPSRYELNTLMFYSSIEPSGGFASGDYLSSSEETPSNPFATTFPSGSELGPLKSTLNYVRPIRAF